MSFVADRRLWLTADQESVVEDGDPAAAFLFVSEGDEVSAEDVERFGLKRAAKAAKQAAQVEDKQAEPAPNKSRPSRKRG